MSVKLSPFFQEAQLDNNGRLLSGGKIKWQLNNTSTLQDTYTTALGDVKHTNPIILNSRGEPPSPIYLTAGVTYMAILYDSLDNVLRTIYDIVGVNDIAASAVTITEWQDLAVSPAYINATSFSVAGDYTSTLETYRRLKTTNTSGAVYSTVVSAVFSAGSTVVVVKNDSTAMDNGLSAVQYSVLDATNTSVPAQYLTDEWVESFLVPTYISTSSFSFVGDQTSRYHVGRRLKIVVTGGTKYATILTSVFGAVTTITVDISTLDAGISDVKYGLVSYVNPSIYIPPEPDEWMITGLTPTYISATSFSVVDDQTAILTVRRGISCSNTGGEFYGYITKTSFGAGITTVTVEALSGTLDAGINTLLMGIVNPPLSSLDGITPAGTILAYSGNAAPVGYLAVPTAATNINRLDYPRLFDALVTNSGYSLVTFTVTIASPGVVTANGHGFVGGEKIRLSTSGALPTGLGTTTDYWVLYVNANTFKLSLTDGGAAINTSGSQSPTHQYLQTNWGFGDGSTTFGMPWIAAGETWKQRGVVGVHSNGQLLAHTHGVYTASTQSFGVTTGGSASCWSGQVLSSTQGVDASPGSGTANVPAGIGLKYMVKY